MKHKPPTQKELRLYDYWAKRNAEDLQPRPKTERPKKPKKVNKAKAEAQIKFKSIGRAEDVEKDVYFIVAGPTVKIGVSSNICARIATLKTGICHPIEAVYVENGRRFSESSLHAKFDAHRMQGEWFSLSDEIRSYIEACVNAAMLVRFR
jgi:hypothetical protein